MLFTVHFASTKAVHSKCTRRDYEIRHICRTLPGMSSPHPRTQTQTTDRRTPGALWELCKAARRAGVLHLKPKQPDAVGCMYLHVHTCGWVGTCMRTCFLHVLELHVVMPASHVHEWMCICMCTIVWGHRAGEPLVRQIQRYRLVPLNCLATTLRGKEKAQSSS